MTAERKRSVASSRVRSAKPQLEPVEKTELYALLIEASADSAIKAHQSIGCMSRNELNNKSEKSGNSYLHIAVQCGSDLVKNGVSINYIVPVIYKLALCGVDVNAKNNAGNTCLHVACVRPHCEPLWEHLIRIGVDPCILNNHCCSVVHNFEGRTCYQVKDQPLAGTGIWYAVEKEDYATVEQYLKSWVRSTVRKNNKSLRELCEGTGNTRVKALLVKYEWVNELVCAAMACEGDMVMKIAKDHSVDVNVVDDSYLVPKPLITAVEELSEVSAETVKVLRELGATNDAAYTADLELYKSAFETSEFYRLLKECSRKSLTAAWSLLFEDKVNVKLRSYQKDTSGWSYLHLISDLYYKTDDIVCRRIMVRCIYKLALLGINVNIKDDSGQTVLLRSFKLEDQTLARHFLTVGCDAALATPSGSCIAIESYLHKGRLTLANRCKRKDIPGLWVAVEDNDVAKAKKALNSWTRVKCMKNGRFIKEFAKSKGYDEVYKVMEEHEHTNEFVSAVFACDLYKMKMLIALGKRLCTVNPVDGQFLAGFRPDLSGEYVPRPLIIPAIEYCTAPAVDFLIRFGADLSSHYEECAPCGPRAFWAYKNDIDSEVTLVVSRYADVSLRDELGHTQLHKAVLRKPDKLKADIVRTLLDRKIDIGARDVTGYTARDYLEVMSSDIAPELMQMIDEHLIHKITNDEYHIVETLIINSYDHVLDIKGHQRKKEARMLSSRELAYLANLQEMVEMLDAYDNTMNKIRGLHEAAKNNDLPYMAKNSGEVRLLQSKDRYGRTLLHTAIQYGHVNIVKYLIDQCPDLVKEKDNLDRTPMHYAAASTIRRQIYGQLANQAGGETTTPDVNNLTPADYIREMDKPTPRKLKLRGRQYYDYQVPELMKSLLARDVEDQNQLKPIQLPDYFTKKPSS